MMEARRPAEDEGTSSKATPDHEQGDDDVKTNVNQPNEIVHSQRGATPSAPPSQSAKPKGEEARGKEASAKSLVDKAATGDDDWEKKVPHVSLLSTLKELDLKLSHQQKQTKKMDKETQKKVQDMSEDIRASITSYLQKRKYLMTMLRDLSSDSSVDWECPAVSVAKARMDEFNKATVQVEEGVTEVLALSKDLDGKLQQGEITFTWLDVTQETGSNEIAFDVINIVQCVCLWYMSHAFKISSGKFGESSTAQYFQSLDKKGVPLPFARFASDLLRKAAGLLQHAISVCDQVKLFGDEHFEDCSPTSLALLRAICISDSQSITVASAIERERSPSLIASLSFSCEDELHKEVLKKGEKGAGGGGAHDKWMKYAEYKMAIAKALGYAHQALTLLQEEEGGKARRCSQEALDLLQVGIDRSLAYCDAKPKTRLEIYSLFHQEMSRLVSSIDRRTERENAIVHMRAVPVELPPPLAKKNITSSIDPKKLPPPEGYQVAKEEIIDSGENDKGSGSCLRWLATWVAFPLLLLISFIGCIVWIILLPFKLVCCPCGMLLQSAWNVMEMMLKAPLHAIRWAAGTTDSKSKEEEETKVEV